MTNTARRYTLGIKGYAAYLASLATQHTDDVVVGRTGSTCDCPLARYLAHQGETFPVVSEGYWDSADGPTTTPKWAARYIRAIDRGRPLLRPVTLRQAQEALAVVVASLA